MQIKHMLGHDHYPEQQHTGDTVAGRHIVVGYGFLHAAHDRADATCT